MTAIEFFQVECPHPHSHQWVGHLQGCKEDHPHPTDKVRIQLEGFVLKTMKKIEENYVSIQFLPFNQIYWIFKKFDMFASLRQQS